MRGALDAPIGSVPERVDVIVEGIRCFVACDIERHDQPVAVLLDQRRRRHALLAGMVPQRTQNETSLHAGLGDRLAGRGIHRRHHPGWREPPLEMQKGCKPDLRVDHPVRRELPEQVVHGERERLFGLHECHLTAHGLKQRRQVGAFFRRHELSDELLTRDGGIQAVNDVEAERAV